MSTALKIVIVGGVAGGMSAATRARRCNEHAQITVIERSGNISFANCGLSYFLDGRIAPKEKLLLTNPKAVAARYRIDARVHQEVLAIDRAAKKVTVRRLDEPSEYTLEYDKLILAPGATPIVPPVANARAANVFLVRNMEDILAADGYIKATKPTRAVVIGAGYIGLETADALTHAGMQVTIIEKADHPLPLMDAEMAGSIATELASNGVTLIAGDGLKELQADEKGIVHTVITESGAKLSADLVVMSIGGRPNADLAKSAGLKIGLSGAIAVDAFQRTSDPDVYAVGDAAEVVHEVTGKATRIALAGPANRGGRLAGEHAATGTSAQAARVLGTSIMQIFSLAAGMTGLSESAAKAAGFDPDCAYVLPNDHAGYYPGAKQMRIKLVYDKPTGRVLGAQAVGPAGVDKRLDVIATAIHFHGTVDDLAQLDLAYAPQYGSAKDAIHYAAFVAQNQRRGMTPSINPRFEIKDMFLLDVRTPAEFGKGTLPGAMNIPVDVLRERVGELPEGRKIAVMCQVGMRGHVATRILRGLGYDAVNVKGGYLMSKQ